MGTLFGSTGFILTILIKAMQWTDLGPKLDMSWYVRKLIKVTSELLARGYDIEKIEGTKDAYKSLVMEKPSLPWPSFLWSRILHPKETFIAWIFAHHKLELASRLCLYMDISPVCDICHRDVETLDHAIFLCDYADVLQQELGSGILAGYFILDMS